MAQSLSKVYVHIVFSTKNRENKIDNKIKDSLFEYIGGICKGLECKSINCRRLSESHPYIMYAVKKNCTNEIIRRS